MGRKEAKRIRREDSKGAIIPNVEEPTIKSKFERESPTEGRVISQGTETENKEIETELKQAEKADRLLRMEKKAKEWRERNKRKNETSSELRGINEKVDKGNDRNDRA